MSLLDLFWNFNQDNRLLELKKDVLDTEERLQQTVDRLREENRDLHIRLGVLIRLLIEKETIKPDDYSNLLKEVDLTLPSSFPQRPSRPAR